MRSHTSRERGARQSPWLIGLVGLLLVGALQSGEGLMPAWAGEPPSEKFDCTVYETKTSSLSLGLKVGNFLFNSGPEISFSRTTGVAWDKAVHGMIARYVELCGRYNVGMVTKVEYETRLAQIEALYKEMQETEAKLYEVIRQRSKESQRELDEALGRQTPDGTDATTVDLETRVQRLADRVERVEPIGRPLKPAAPCPPPDMLGAPGVHADPGRKC